MAFFAVKGGMESAREQTSGICSTKKKRSTKFSSEKKSNEEQKKNIRKQLEGT